MHPQLVQIQRPPGPTPILQNPVKIHPGPPHFQMQGNNLINNRLQPVFNQNSGVGMIRIPPPTHQSITNFQPAQAGHLGQLPIRQNQPFITPTSHHNFHQIQHQPFSNHSPHPQPHFKSHSQPHFSGHQQYPQVINRGPIPMQIPMNIHTQAQTYSHVDNLK